VAGPDSARLVDSFTPLSGAIDLAALSYFNGTLACSFPNSKLVSLHTVDAATGLVGPGRGHLRGVWPLNLPDAEGLEFLPVEGGGGSDTAVAFVASDLGDSVVRLVFDRKSGFASCDGLTQPDQAARKARRALEERAREAAVQSVCTEASTPL